MDNKRMIERVRQLLVHSQIWETHGESQREMILSMLQELAENVPQSSHLEKRAGDHLTVPDGTDDIVAIADGTEDDFAIAFELATLERNRARRRRRRQRRPRRGNRVSTRESIARSNRIFKKLVSIAYLIDVQGRSALGSCRRCSPSHVCCQ